jgi:hypothetical protein
MKRFYGKYPGKVESNMDPEQRGRLQVSVPDVLGGGRLGWATPCVPFAGPGVGFFAIPPRGANVWVEFVGGDPCHAIWSGCYWARGEAPRLPALAETKVFKTECVTLVLNDAPGSGGFTLEVSPPAVPAPLKLVCNGQGIELSNGNASVKLTATGVSINNGALEVI